MILTNLLIILFSVSVGTVFVNKKIDISLENDLKIIASIADRYITGELEALKLKAVGTASLLAESDESKWKHILDSQEGLHPDFIGMAVFDAGRELVASAGEKPAAAEITNDKYIRQSFEGKKTVSSTIPAGNDILLYLAVPLPSAEPDGAGQPTSQILVITLSGMYFSEVLSSIVIWETGQVFISDREGYVIANMREKWVQERYNYITLSDTDESFAKLSEMVVCMTRGESGVSYYALDGIPRACAYAPISGSGEGWSLGVVAPLPENPVGDTSQGLIAVAFVGIFLSILAALIASNFIKRPFEEIAALKEVAEMNSKYKSKFLATMSHEIRTPMNVVLGVTDSQLLNESLLPNTRTAFEKIYDAGHLLLNIINDILDLSKIESGKFDMYPINYEILSLINDSVNIHAMQFSHKQIDFRLKLDENIPVFLCGDELRIKQILNNLLSNAYKYTRTGEVELSFNAENTIEGVSTTLVIAVRDTGQGMTPEQISQLFDEYKRFNTDTNRTTVGTGLGMTITRNLVHMMNGRITVESEPDKGSLFTVYIPQEITGPGKVGRESADNLEKFNFSNHGRERNKKIVREQMPYGKVLVVDDMNSNLDVAKLLLAPYKLQVDTAESGFDAIDKIKEGNIYDLILMDHMMPKMDGIETTRRIHNTGYRYPIFVLTANAVVGQQEIFLASGFDGHISKPIDLRQLNDILNKYIRNKHCRDVKNTDLHEDDAEEAPADDAAETSPIPAIEIPGIDSKIGLAIYDGDKGIFINVMRAFVPNALSVIEKLRIVTEETLDEYAINVHGLKGISAGIGAEDLKIASSEMEAIAKSENLGAVLAANGEFIRKAESLTANVIAWIKENADEGSKPLLPCPDKNLLHELRKHCEAYDISSVDEVMNKLESCRYESDASLVIWLRERINESDFSSVVEKLS